MADGAPIRRRGRLARATWTGAGFSSVGVGSVGLVVPGLPSTAFFVLAAWCFSHSSPRFEQWVLDLPRVGPLVRDFRAGLGMPRRAKVTAITMMWAAIAVSAVLLRDRPVIALVNALLGVVGTAYLTRWVPTRAPRPASP